MERRAIDIQPKSGRTPLPPRQTALRSPLQTPAERAAVAIELAAKFGGTFAEFEMWLHTQPDLDLREATITKQLNMFSQYKRNGLTVPIIEKDWEISEQERKAASEYFNGATDCKVAPFTWRDRIDHYVAHTKYPEAMFIAKDGRVVGTWFMGNDYRVKSGLYGGYPATYLKRIKALFPDKQCVLHLFSGMVDQAIMPGDTVDVNASLRPTYVDDAQTLHKVPLEGYDLVMADPPYSQEDANHYNTSMVHRNRVMSALQRVQRGTHIVWLDQILPMYRKDAFSIVAAIGMLKSTNHRFRMITIFERI